MLLTFKDATDRPRIPNQRRRLEDFVCLVTNDLARIIILLGFDVVINYNGLSTLELSVV